MKSLILITLILSMVVALVKAQGRNRPDGPGGPPFGPGGPRGPGGKRGPPPPIGILEMFPACENMVQAMRETHRDMMRNGEIGPGNCRESNDHRECWRKDMNKVRCSVTETPSSECMDQINSFMKGDNCNNATTENSTNNDGVTST